MIRELQNYINLKLSFELPNIIVKQRESEEPKVYEGPGSLYQDEEGNLILKMYSNISESFSSIFNDDSPPGKIIAENNYYDLTAVDMYGKIWKSEKVSIGKNYGDGGKFLIILAGLNKVTCEENLPEIENGSTLILYFNKNIKLPVSPFFEIPELKEKEIYKNVRLFTTLKIRDYQIIISEQTNWIEFNISSKQSALPKNIDSRICEALQFITYTKLNWFFFYKFEGKKYYQKLNNYNYYKIIEGLTPPYNINSGTSKPNWEMFKLYLNYILDYPNPQKYHTISSLLNLIIQAEKLPIDTRFQTICICIESILKSEFDFEIEVDIKLKEHQLDLIGYINENINNEEYKKRLKSLIGQLSNTRPVDKLYKLANDNLIEERMILDWEWLRHPLIHGERIKTEKLQEYLDKYYSTLTLFYQLIFLKIGYIGKYTDYSSVKWPTKEFKNKLN